MEKNFLQKVSSSFSSARKWWILGIIIVFTIIVFLLAGGQYYNSFARSLDSRTKGVIKLPIVTELPFRLGLDLQGGTHLVYEADVSNIPEADRGDALNGARDIIERRVNVFGVDEPLVQVSRNASGDYRVIVELAGIKDVNEAIKMIGETPLLEFKELDNSQESESAKAEKLKQLNAAIKTEAEKALAKAITNQDLNAVATEYSSNGSVDNTAWYNEQDDAALIAAVKSAEKGKVLNKIYESATGYEILKLEDVRDQAEAFSDTKTGLKDYQINRLVFSYADADSIQTEWKNTNLTGKYLKRATVQFNPNDNSPEVSLEFDDEGAKLFEEITDRNVGSPVAIFLDGFAISTPTVNEKITGGQASISGSFTTQEAKLLAQRLNSGALPVPIALISQETIDASLGMDSIDKSLKSGLIGLLLIAIFMIVYYRLPGLASVLALAVYGLTVLAIFKAAPIVLGLIVVVAIIALMMISFSDLKIFNSGLSLLLILFGVLLFTYILKSVTLTLSGLAGFVLSMGMAVDANVLIFERMKEELRAGKPLKLAIDEGFRRAWPSIRDGNITTILICFILIFFGTGTIKGFGTVLFIGVVISMFSAIVISHNLLSLLPTAWLDKNRWLLGVRNKKQ
jgi:protein-export membrane protein SecD